MLVRFSHVRPSVGWPSIPAHTRTNPRPPYDTKGIIEIGGYRDRTIGTHVFYNGTIYGDCASSFRSLPKLPLRRLHSSPYHHERSALPTHRSGNLEMSEFCPSSQNLRNAITESFFMKVVSRNSSHSKHFFQF